MNKVTKTNLLHHSRCLFSLAPWWLYLIQERQVADWILLIAFEMTHYIRYYNYISLHHLYFASQFHYQYWFGVSPQIRLSLEWPWLLIYHDLGHIHHFNNYECYRHLELCLATSSKYAIGLWTSSMFLNGFGVTMSRNLLGLTAVFCETHCKT